MFLFGIRYFSYEDEYINSFLPILMFQIYFYYLIVKIYDLYCRKILIHDVWILIYRLKFLHQRLFYDQVKQIIFTPMKQNDIFYLNFYHYFSSLLRIQYMVFMVWEFPLYKIFYYLNKYDIYKLIDTFNNITSASLK